MLIVFADEVSNADSVADEVAIEAKKDDDAKMSEDEMPDSPNLFNRLRETHQYLEHPHRDPIWIRKLNINLETWRQEIHTSNREYKFHSIHNVPLQGHLEVVMTRSDYANMCINVCCPLTVY